MVRWCRIALAVLGCSLLCTAVACSTSSGSGGEVGVSSTTSATATPTSAIAGKLRPATADLQFRPVLGMFMPPEGQRCHSVGQPTGSHAVVIPSANLRGTDTTVCYQLGPVKGDASDIASAHADAGSGGWEVIVTPAPGAGVKRLNGFFNDCYRGTGGCRSTVGGTGPVSGSAAVVFNGEVLTAPTVMGADLASGDFVLSGNNFTKAQATELAQALNRVG